MNNKTKILGIAGTNGAGKDTVGKILADDHNYLFISVTDLLREEAKNRNQPAGREVLRQISAEWRRESGLGVLIDKAVEAYKKVESQYQGVVMASLRNPGEATRVHEMGGQVIWLDAEPKVRYDRIQANMVARDRAEEDNKTFEQFLAEEEAEMHQSGDVATLNMSGVKDESDIIIMNDQDDISLLRQAIEASLGL
jgi:dephospho-CoA kinase